MMKRTTTSISCDCLTLSGSKILMSKSVTSDRNLLFGILAWENGAITQAQFLDAMQFGHSIPARC